MSRPKWRALAALLVLAACFAPRVATPVPAPLAPWAQVLGAAPGLTFAAATERDSLLPAPGGGFLLVDERLPATADAWSAPQRDAWRRFVHDGGRLVLFGAAGALVHDLELDGAAPECSQFRWGYDARATNGAARLGFQVVSGQLPELFADLPPSALGDDVCLLAGDAPCTAPVCAWTHQAPMAGVVLARLATQRDGVNDPLGAPVVVHWTYGKGAIVACGLVPRIEHQDQDVRAAAIAFVQRCAAWARQRGPLLVAAAPLAAPAPAVPELPRMAPLVPHWGWRLPQTCDGLERSADELRNDALLPSWLAGATLAELEIADDGGKAPLDWRSGDPLLPAPSFESRAANGPWQASMFQTLAAEAHARGMLAFGALDPAPVGARAAERYATLRFLARELACVRRVGAGALDGFGVAQWAPDAAGISIAMLQDFAPAGLVYRCGETAAALAGGLRAVDARDGAVRGLPFAGVSSSWRGSGFAADAFPLGLLDARARSDGLAWGSTADWIVTQANDFARARAGRGAAMLWRRHDPAAFDRDTLDYVHGVALEPLRAAVAMPLSSTGADGLRAAGAAFVPGLPAGFATAVPAPSAVRALQNNWFRLLGSGGALEFDASGRAEFGSTAVRVCPTFLRTRLFGGRPDGRAVRSERIDLLASGVRGEGGYGPVVRVGNAAGAEAATPARLQREATPAWPAAVQFDWLAETGYYELDLLPRAVRGRGVLTIALDGVLLRAVAFDETAGSAVTVPVHVARAGQRMLEIALGVGGGVTFDRLVLRRAGDVGVEAAVTVPAGSFAALAESSQSSYHAERLELATVADLPGFVLRARCGRAVRNLQVERTFAFDGYRLRECAAGEDADDLRSAFVLGGRSDGAPDVVVVPLLQTRHERLRWRDGELTWRHALAAGTQNRLGVLFCRAGSGAKWLAPARTMLAAVLDPLELDLTGNASAEVANELSLPWTRIVKVRTAAPTPFCVREQGYWYWRGSQPATDGERWLRVQLAPGDTVQVEGGPATLARPRPGPGCAGLLAVRDGDRDGDTTVVRVLQASALVTPSVTMPRDFDAVDLDGEGWAHFDGRTVFLPNRVGTFTLRTRRHAGGPAPHVRATRAPLQVCRYLPASRELVLMTPGVADRPAELPWTAVLVGPLPQAIENGEIVDDTSLRYPDATALAAARAGGVLIRFRNGVCRVRYGEEPAASR